MHRPFDGFSCEFTSIAKCFNLQFIVGIRKKCGFLFILCRQTTNSTNRSTYPRTPSGKVLCDAKTAQDFVSFVLHYF